MSNMNVKDLIDLLQLLVKNKQAKLTDEVWISSDEEGNSFSRLEKDTSVGLEPSKLTFYPHERVIP